MHSGKKRSAGCFLKDAQHILQLQMTPGQDSGAVKVNDITLLKLARFWKALELVYLL